MQYLLFIFFLCLCWAVLCWCVFKLITCNGSPLCRKWSLNSNPDRFWAKRRSLAKLGPTPCNPSPLPKIHLQTDFSLTWHHDIILIVCSKDTMRKMMLKCSLDILFMRGRKHILSLLSLASAVVISQGVSWGGAGSWKPSNYWLDPLSGQRPLLSLLSSPLHPVCSHSIHLNLALNVLVSPTKLWITKAKGFWERSLYIYDT